LETGSEAYYWLNKVVAFSVITNSFLDRGYVILEVYRVSIDYPETRS